MNCVRREGRGPRRGMVALTVATGIMFLLLGVLAGYALGLVVEQRQVEETGAAMQAYYAAEAGLAVLAHSGAPEVSGACGRARYHAARHRDEVGASGEVELASGRVVRRTLGQAREGEQ